MGGRDGLCCPGGCPKALKAAACSNPDKTTKAITGNKDLCFLFMADLFCNDSFLNGAKNFANLQNEANKNGLNFVSLKIAGKIINNPFFLMNCINWTSV
jgi:hypothetical protein